MPSSDRLLDALFVLYALYVVGLYAAGALGLAPMPGLGGLVRPALIAGTWWGVHRGQAPWQLGLVVFGAGTALRVVVDPPSSVASAVETGMIVALGVAAWRYHRDAGFPGAWSPGFFSELLSLLHPPTARPIVALGSDLDQVRADLRHLVRTGSSERDVEVEVWTSDVVDGKTVVYARDGRVEDVTYELGGATASEAQVLRDLRFVLAGHEAGSPFEKGIKTPYFQLFRREDEGCHALWAYPSTLTVRSGGR